jgi:hypothetical protein
MCFGGNVGVKIMDYLMGCEGSFGWIVLDSPVED